MPRSTPSRPDGQQNEPPPLGDDIPSLLEALADTRAAVRMRAREALIERGDEVVAPLVELLQHETFHVRWEAAKALEQMQPPAAVVGLTRALRDEEQDVRWVASDALIAIGRPAIEPLLRALIEHGDSYELCQSARRILQHVEDPDLQEIVEDSVLALGHVGAESDVIPAAEKALARLRGK
jgi:HEAT repeat protein